LSTSYRSSAYSLIKAADEAAQTLRTPAAAALEYEVDRDEVDASRLPRPPSVPGIKDLSLPEMADLQALTDITDTFTGTKPTLRFPNFSYPALTEPGEFTDQPPTITPLTVIPVAPELDTLLPPVATVPTEVTVDVTSGDPPDVPLPTFTEFDGDFFSEYETGIDLMDDAFAEWTDYFERLRATLLPMEAALQQRLRGILDGSEPGLPDTWETQTYEQSQQDAYDKRYVALDQIDTAPGGITGLPSGQRGYVELRLELQTLQSLAQAAAKTANARQQQEVKHVQWALRVALGMAEAALRLQSQEASWRMKGLLLALEGASETLDLALRVLKFKEKELAMLVRYNDTQVRRTEDRVKIEKTKLEKLSIQVANNKLKATYNQNQARIDETAFQFIESRVKLFEAQIDYLLVDQDWRKLDFARFDAEVQAYQARLKAATAEHAALRARIKGDLARADGELAEAKLYEAEMQAQQSLARATLIKVRARANEMKQILGAYNSQIGAVIQWLREVDRNVDLAMRALVKRFDAEVHEQYLTLANQDLEDQMALFNARNDMKEDQLALLKTLQIHAVALDQATAQGRIMAQGASTLGGIAQAAYAGLNSVGTTEILATV
jgi:hypothetical protein